MIALILTMTMGELSPLELSSIRAGDTEAVGLISSNHGQNFCHPGMGFSHATCLASCREQDSLS